MSLQTDMISEWYDIISSPTKQDNIDGRQTVNWRMGLVSAGLRLRHVGVLSQISSVKELFTSELANSPSLGFQYSGGRDGRENCLFLWLTIDVNFVTDRHHPPHLATFFWTAGSEECGGGRRSASQFLNGKTELDVEEGSHEQNDKHLPAATPLFPGSGYDNTTMSALWFRLTQCGPTALIVNIYTELQSYRVTEYHYIVF